MLEIIKKRRFSEIAFGFFLLSHPGPVLLHVLGITVFTLLAAWPRFVWSVVVLVIAAHTVMQLSIAFLNDYCDRSLDAAANKKHKPLVRGLIRPREALIAGIVMMVLMVLLLLPLNPLALLISLLYLLLAQGYNLGLKSTPLSGIVFALAMPLIPLYAFAGVGRVPPVVFWLVPIGFMLGVALNLANSLPDIEEDAAYGKHTLAVVLGLTRSFLACQLLIVCAIVVIGVLALWRIVPAQIWLLLPTLTITCAAVGAMSLFFGPRKPEQRRKTYFYLVALTCIVLAIGWLIGVII